MFTAAEPAPRLLREQPSTSRLAIPVVAALLAAIPLLMISNGRYSVWLAAWLSPVLLLRLARGGRPASRLLLVYALLSGGFAFQFQGMVPIPGWGYFAFLLVNGLFLAAPYTMDRLLHPRGIGRASIWVFPSAWAATEFLYSLGPYGSWGSAAYSQFGNLPLLQILSVTGLWGITFLIGWFAAAVNRAWEQSQDSGSRWGALWVCLGALTAVFLAGGLRMAMAPPDAPSVRIASITRGEVQPKLDSSAFASLLAGRAGEAEIEAVRRWAEAVNSDLLARADREARSGAKIIFWAEGNALAFKEDEGALVGRGRDLAREHQVYLGMAVAVWNRDRKPPLENKLVLIEPDGEVAWEFSKAHPVPGGEAALSVAGDGRLPLSETPYGRLSAAICFDADFPRLLRQAGLMRTDILLDPSNDWREIDPWHTQMASFRAVEQGFNLVRHTSNGLSAAFDYQGRLLAHMDHFQAADRILVAQVPTAGVRTVYSRVGDLFGWATLALLSLLAAGRWRSSHR